MQANKFLDSNYTERDVFEGIIVETFRDGNASRPRVRPVDDYFGTDIKVHFPRSLREEYPLGSRFRTTVTVAQKHNKDGSLRGQPYLDAKKASIHHIKDYTPLINNVKAVRTDTRSGRIYEYVHDDSFSTSPDNELLSLRKAAIDASTPYRDAYGAVTTTRKRDIAIKKYALARAGGICEGCGEYAPFAKRNNEPYLEVHHLTELKDGGADSPKNVASLCPNCHSHVTHGIDACEYNNRIRLNVEKIESDIATL